MVRSDKGSAGVLFTLDTESGFRDVVTISGAYGLGEVVVKGAVIPDAWMVFKPTLAQGHRAVTGRQLGTKAVRLVYSSGKKGTRRARTPAADRARYCLTDDEVLMLARWGVEIENHYSALAGHPQPMDIEWAKDGVSGELVVVQARPETVHSTKPRTAAAETYRPGEENPMLGFRGASRYYDERYAEGFALECAALLRARHDLGLTNIKIMIPFCRTMDEGRRVLDAMAANGLRRGESGIEVYGMCEVPSNAILAEEFLNAFDGFSIGSNDLAQLTLGLDRDSGTVAHLFDERNDAVRWLIARVIAAGHRLKKPVGICGQAPSDYPEFAEWLVSQGIDSISLNPDVAVATTMHVAKAEADQSSRSVPLSR